MEQRVLEHNSKNKPATQAKYCIERTLQSKWGQFTAMNSLNSYVIIPVTTQMTQSHYCDSHQSSAMVVSDSD